MELLEVEHLSIAFSQRRKAVVEDCSFVLKEKEILGIVGESGSGKSTMVMSVPGFLRKGAYVTQGRIRYRGDDITPRDMSHKNCCLRGSEIAVIMQNAMSCLDPLMKIGPQMTESIILHTGCTRQKARAQAIELLDMVGIRDACGCMKKYPFECSGGMQQRICIAIAISASPSVLIADEPTTALDVLAQAQILNLLRIISRDMGIAVILVSHDLGVVASLCNRMLVMEKGKIIEEGETRELFYSSSKEYTKKLIQARLNLEGIDFVKRRDEKRKKELLRAEQISRIFRGKKVLREISVEIGEGQIYGLAGESGCGKSTLARILAGIDRKNNGELRWKGQRIQMIFQNPYQSFNPAMTIRENLREALWAAGIREAAEVCDQIENVFKEMEIPLERQEGYPKELSGGQLQRISIARALLLKPDLLICDEPFSGLDMYIQEQLIRMLEERRRRDGFSVFFIGHDLSVLRWLSDVLGIIYAGLIVEEGPADKVSEEPWHPYTKALFLASDKVRVSGKSREIPVVSEPPAASAKDRGCPYALNCKYSEARCYVETPGLYAYGERKIRCFLYAEDAEKIRDPRYRMGAQI